VLDSNISPTCPHNMVNFGPLAAEIGSVVWGIQANFSGFRVLASLLHGIRAVGTSQTLRRWTEGASYIRQGGHQVGHWPTCSFSVSSGLTPRTLWLDHFFWASWFFAFFYFQFSSLLFCLLVMCGRLSWLFISFWAHILLQLFSHFMALFPGPPGWTGARRALLDFMVQGKINRGRHTDHLAGRQSIRTNQCPPPPPSPHFFTGRMPFLPPNQQCQSTEGN